MNHPLGEIYNLDWLTHIQNHDVTALAHGIRLGHHLIRTNAVARASSPSRLCCNLILAFTTSLIRLIF